MNKFAALLTLSTASVVGFAGVAHAGVNLTPNGCAGDGIGSVTVTASDSTGQGGTFELDMGQTNMAVTLAPGGTYSRTLSYWHEDAGFDAAFQGASAHIGGQGCGTYTAKPLPPPSDGPKPAVRQPKMKPTATTTTVAPDPTPTTARPPTLTAVEILTAYVVQNGMDIIVVL